jgi:two-component system phosphate regulon sensor histidine kinase PhoR
MGTFELSFRERDSKMPEPPQKAELGSALLLQNARWFMQVRWSVVAVFIAAGLIGKFLPDAQRALGLSLPFAWMWSFAAVLIAANAVFYLLAHRFPPNPRRASVKVFLWSEIAVDLVVVTLLVHVVGSTQTFISFVYLFHVSLACIFFPKRESFMVTLAAAILYLLAVVGELTGTWPSSGVFTDTVRLPPVRSPLALVIAGSAVFTWWVVWYLVSTLSEAVRRRDLQLSAANEQIQAFDREQNRYMMMTVHELKVPFAGIESHIDVLRDRFWETITPEVRPILERVDHSAQLLSERISQVLFLGNLRSGAAPRAAAGFVDVPRIIESALSELDQKARQRRIQFMVRVPPLAAPGDAEQMTALFTNLVSNAVLYSPEGGTVEIGAREEGDEVRVVVQDHGIGIREEALPHIFDDFYRTNEGARFNRMSTGLGLAIVKEIAGRLGLRLTVTSEQGKGTTFEVGMPKAGHPS